MSQIELQRYFNESKSIENLEEDLMNKLDELGKSNLNPEFTKAIEFVIEETFNIAFLEEANNRFTTTCRRLLNKKGYKEYKKLGPLYYMIEELENIADQYKYLCKCLGNRNK